MTLAGATLNGKARRAAISETRLAYSTQGRLPAWDLNDAARHLSVGARRPPTNVKEAVNGSRAVGRIGPLIMGRNSPQPSHYLTGNTADGLEPTVPLPVMVRLDDASGKLGPEASSLFFREADHTHSISPVLSIASANMEEVSVSVSPKILGKVSESDIDQARMAGISHIRLSFLLTQQSETLESVQ